MQLDSVRKVLGIANYKVEYMVHHSEKKIEFVLKQTAYMPACSLTVRRP